MLYPSSMELGLAVFVMLVGLVMLAKSGRWDTIAAITFGAGLLATLLKFAGHASFHISGG